MLLLASLVNMNLIGFCYILVLFLNLKIFRNAFSSVDEILVTLSTQ